MPGRPLTIEIDESLRTHLDAAAEAAGLSAEHYVLKIIEDALLSPGFSEDATTFEGPDQRTEAARRYQREQAGIALAEYRRTGESIPLEEALSRFDDALEAALSGKR